MDRCGLPEQVSLESFTEKPGYRTAYSGLHQLETFHVINS